MITLEQLTNGESAIIVRVDAGCGLRERLCCINIREGKYIKKIASQPLHGPIIIEIDKRQCAIGRGMAKKIFVDER